MRAAAIVAAVGAALVCAYLVGSIGVGDSRQALDRLAVELESQQRDTAELRARVTQSERQLQIERAAASDLAKQVKELSFDNAALREDLAVFQSLAKAEHRRKTGLTVNRLRLQQGVAAGEYRYQMLLIQSGQQKEFQGRIEFVLDVQQDGKTLSVTVPPENDRGAANYQLDFKFFQRVEGAFSVPPGGAVKSMQVRVFENGSPTPKLTQTVGVF